MGRLLKARSTYYDATSILVVEPGAMRDGVYAAIKEGFKHSLIEWDNKIFMQTLQGVIKLTWQIQSLIKDVLVWK